MAKKGTRAPSRTLVQTKKTEEPEPEFVTNIKCIFDNQLGKYLSKMSERGYELFGQPTFTHFGEPPGWNGAAVGNKHPFMVVILRKTAKL